jgi:hypothetical protein
MADSSTLSLGLRPPLPFPLGSMVPPPPGINLNMAMRGMPPFIHPAAMK